MKFSISLAPGLRQAPVSDSSSTRASSSNTPLEDFAQRKEDSPLDLHSVAQKLNGESASTAVTPHILGSRRKAFALGLALAALLSWLWQRRVDRLSRSAKQLPFGRIIVAMFSMATPIVHALGYKPGRSDLAIPERVPEGQKMICCHPHGLYLAGGVLNNIASGFCQRAEGPLKGMMVVGSDAVFDIPIINGLLLLANFRKAKRYVIDKLLARGKTIALYPGGIHEQLRTDPGQERCFFPPNLGFIRDAMNHGVPLVPLYTFGEGQLYDVPQWSRRFSKFLKARFGVGMPLGIGRFGVLPKQMPLRSVLGRPVDVGPKGQEPNDERLEEVFKRYCAELRRLFAENKDAHLPPEVAARGLEIIWRGREELTAELSLLPTAEIAAEVASPAAPSPRAVEDGRRLQASAGAPRPPVLASRL